MLTLLICQYIMHLHGIVGREIAWSVDSLRLDGTKMIKDGTCCYSALCLALKGQGQVNMLYLIMVFIRIHTVFFKRSQ